MSASYRDRIRGAIADISVGVAAVQSRVSDATDEYERAKSQGKLAQLRADPLAQWSQVPIAKAELEQSVERMKELAAQIPADSDDGGLFDALAVARAAVETAERFIENSRGDDGT